MTKKLSTHFAYKDLYIKQVSNFRVKAITKQYDDEEKIKEEESQSIQSYNVELDPNSKYVTIKVECGNNVDKITATLSGNMTNAMQTAYSNKAELKIDIPYSNDYVTYRLQITAYTNNVVTGKKITNITACRNKTFGEATTEVLADGTAMLGGVVTGIVNGAFVQPVMAAASGIDFIINIKNPEQYESNQKWRDGLIEKAENFMISNLPAEQYYYYNCGIEGGEISEFCVGTVYAVKGVMGVVTKLENVGDGVKTAKVLLDNGDEIVVMAGKDAKDVAVVATKNIADVADSISKIPDKGFSSFSKLKKYLGKAGDGFEWHHIVEQTQIEKAGFAADEVNNLRNIVKIPGGYSGSVHSKISGYYNSTKQFFTNGLSVRDWLSTQSFEVQFNFGVEKLREFGELIATKDGWVFIPFE